jgi:hypothetical protein
MTDATHIHMPSRQEVKIKKAYDSIAVCFVDPYPISLMWGKEEYSNTIIVKINDLKPIGHGKEG